MKKLILAMTAVCTAMVSSSLRAELNWGAGDYTPADWKPAANNLLADNKAAFAGTMYPEDKCSEDPATVTDGMVPGASCDYKKIFGIADNSSLTWNLAEASDIESLRVFTRWGDGGRSGIGISSVKVWYDGDADWTTLEGSALSYQIKQSGSASLYGVLTNTNGRAIAENVIKLQVNFGTQDNSGAGYVEFEATEFIAPEKPVVRYGAVKSAMNRAMFSALVESCGEGAGSVSFKLAYAKHGETMPEATVVGVPATAGGTLHYVLTDLDEGAAYDYELSAVNDLAVDCKKVLTGSFTVSSVLDIGPVTRPGLVQAKFGEKVLFSSNVQPPLVSNLLSRTDCELDYAYGAFMAHFAANGTDTYTNPYSGTKWGWESQYSVFAYEGEVYLRKGEVIAVTGRYDDGSAAVVDGVSVFEQGNNSGYNSSEKNHAIYMAKADGWYPLNCWVWDWSGGKAVCQSYISGLQYNLNGEWANFTSAEHWKPLNDTDGKGSFLRSVDRSTSVMQISAVEQDGPTVNVTASFAGVPRESKFRAYTSTTRDCGDSPSDWSDFIEIATIQPGDTPSDTYVVANLANYPFVRFAIVVDPAAGPVDISKDPCTAYWQVSDLMQFETSGLTVLIASPTMTYTNGTVSVMVANMGDATSLDLTLEVATDDGFQNVISSQDAGTGVTSPGSRVMHIEDLEAATTYYVRVKVVADGADPIYTEVSELTTVAYPPARISRFVPEKADDVFCSFRWSLDDLGDQSDSVTISVEYADSEDFSSGFASVEVVSEFSGAGSDMRAVVRNLVPSTAKYFRLKTVNAKGSVSYSDPIQLMTSATPAKTLVWANTGTDMNSADSYLELRAPTEDDTVYFVDAPVVQPQLTGDLTIYSLQFNGLDNLACPASGYELSAADEAMLTISAHYYNQDTQYAILGHFSGTNTISAPVYFSGGKPQVGGTGMTLLFKGPVSTKDDYSQEFNYSTSKSGVVIFGHANPDFKPKRLYGGGSSRFGFTDPDALMSLTKLEASSWAAGDDKTVHFQNLTGSAVSFPNLVALSLGDTDSFAVEGSPVIASNCVFSSTDRGTSYAGNTLLLVKSVENAGGWGCNFVQNANGGALQVLEDFVSTVDGVVPSLNVNNGMYVITDFAKGFPASEGSHNRFNGDDGRIPILGIGEDASVRLAYNGGIFFGHTNGEDKPGGFAAMGGERHLTLLDANNTKYDPVMLGQRPLDDPSGDNKDWATPSQLHIGNKWATGTVVFENNFSFSGDTTIYVHPGQAYVAGRFAGSVEFASGKKLLLSGGGVVAFEGDVNFGFNGNFKEGGVLFNGTRTGDYTAKTGTLVGGTGTVEGNFAVDSGATLRPGELGGTLTVKNGMVSLEGNPKVVIDIASDKNSCLAIESESAYLYKTDGSGAVTMEINLLEGAPESGTVKIMDWSNAVTGDLTNLFDPSSYVLTYDAEKISKATLTRDDEAKALYLNYESRKCGVGLLIIIR